MKLKYGDSYQLTLILLGVLATVFFAVFFYRELFPEYRIYQDDFIKLEKFRSSYTGEPPPPFHPGVKQIVFEREDKGPSKVERCISCHVALEIPDYSPTVVVHDKDGNVVVDKSGKPVQEANKNYIWTKLELEITRLDKEGNQSEADKLRSLKTAQVGEIVYDITKVLSAHPLIGKETRAFEFHPLQEYGCVSCHNGNGQGLVTDKAHGPVFDHTYETEFMGHKAEFLERDEKNDPPFSKVFNDKPGHKLLFQTSPLYVGALMQAKCINCHLTTSDKESLVSLLGEQTSFKGVPSEIDSLLPNYEKGKELFVTQGCYACHRIAGYARGGVGPELTKEGNSYPWFIKESIVWPQADLKTSTMPNYRLDHDEVENLMTFLLAQKGEREVLKGTLYHTYVTKWDRGALQPWEKSSSAAQIHDLDYGMTIFATEGCAACHRLQGYSSTTGFTGEKVKDRQWFTSLFDEHISGSDLFERIEQNKDDIDKKIALNARKEGLLDALEKDNQGIISSFYPAFSFAERKSTDKKYQERLHKVLMMFVEEYGLGRQVGPKPNWSGVYRSNEWLYAHFKNPQAEIPRSIMPVFPFDDTKFFALVTMLDTLGKRNRDALRAPWNKNGFDPEQAYRILCAQCHGDYLEGNGPVAEWIYPIPKNLRKAEFLRTFTKERISNAIKHGVKGTPMPPWGEVGDDKVSSKEETKRTNSPVLSDSDIEKLTDWLFSFIQGGEVIRDSKDVPKWNYTPGQVIEELNREGETLQKTIDYSSYFPKGRGFVAAVGPVQTSEMTLSVSDLFNVVEGTKGDPDEKQYFIKKEYYTPENIAEGQSLFYENCASCHGKEADGSGLRAEAMYDAKPRMLTNMNWIESRDDMRLLRSIKYGVAGTSMQPWGDVTNSKQRLQLVIFIRSLTQDAIIRSNLMDELYLGFEQVDFQLQEARFKEAKELENLKSAYEKAAKDLEAKETLEAFKLSRETKTKYQEQEERDRLFSDLRDTLKEMKAILHSIGTAALNQDPKILKTIEEYIRLVGSRITVQKGKLSFNDSPELNDKIKKQVTLIQTLVAEQIGVLKKETVEGKTPEQVTTLKSKILALESFQTKTLEGMKLIKIKQEREGSLIKEINKAP